MMKTAKRVISGTAIGGSVIAGVFVYLGLVTPEHIALGAAAIAGGITVFTSWVAASKSISTDRKVDNVTLLVDGRYGDVLKELADVRGILAQRSGAPHDIARAVEARKESDDQDAKVQRSEAVGR
jgi:hypothetical protein